MAHVVIKSTRKREEGDPLSKDTVRCSLSTNSVIRGGKPFGENIQGVLEKLPSGNVLILFVTFSLEQIWHPLADELLPWAPSISLFGVTLLVLNHCWRNPL